MVGVWLVYEWCVSGVWVAWVVCGWCEWCVVGVSGVWFVGDVCGG